MKKEEAYKAAAVGCVILVMMAYALWPNSEKPLPQILKCDNPCSMSLLETIPTGLSFNSSIVQRSTHEEWLDFIDNAKEYIDIATPFWNLNSSGYPTVEPGRLILLALAKARSRSVDISIVRNARGMSDNPNSLWFHKELPIPRFDRLMGGGLLNSKFIIVDGKHIYLGSAGMDWKALSESKELGIVIRDCPCVAADLLKIFKAYWCLGSPREFYHFSRDNDLGAILSLIRAASQTICISVADFTPVINKRYWPVLDGALCEAAYRGVAVRLLLDNSRSDRRQERSYLENLAKISPVVKGSIEIKWFTFPETAEQQKIGHARVSHNNYVVTENAGYIGTASWVGDDFKNSGNVGIVVSSKDSESVQEQLQAVFDRDWNSEYASPF